MPQELQAETPSLVGALYESRNIQHDERTIPHVSNAKPRLQRREWIITDLGGRARHHTQQRRLSRIRGAKNRHIGQEFHFQLNVTLLARLSPKRDERLLIRRTREVHVPEPSEAPVHHGCLRPVRNELHQELPLPPGHIPHHRPHRHLHHNRPPFPPRAVSAPARSPLLANDSANSFQMPQRPNARNSPKNDRPPFAARPPVWASARTELLPEKGNCAISSPASDDC